MRDVRKQQIDFGEGGRGVGGWGVDGRWPGVSNLNRRLPYFQFLVLQLIDKFSTGSIFDCELAY